MIIPSAKIEFRIADDSFNVSKRIASIFNKVSASSITCINFCQSSVVANGQEKAKSISDLSALSPRARDPKSQIFSTNDNFFNSVKNL